MRQRPFFTSLLAGSLLLGAAGCPDPEGKFNAFDERAPSGTAGSLCAAAQPDMMVTGQYFFSLTPTDSPGTPAPFLADVVVDGGNLTIELTPLDANDRTTVITETKQGDPVMPQSFGPFPINDGLVTMDLADARVPGNANPVSENNLVVQATLEAAFCSDGSLLCGTFEADVTQPFALELLGTFAFQPIDNGVNPEPPIIDCDGTTADPL